MSAALRLEPSYAEPINPGGKLSPGWWVMVCVITTEAMLFVYLFAAYFYLGATARTPWPPVAPPPLNLVLPNTLILLSSSGTAWWADRGIRRGNTTRLARGLAATILLGAIFLFIQGIEFSKETFSPRSHAYGSMFFTITSFHGGHVAVGLLMLLHTLLRSRAGHFSATRRLGVTNSIMYWHFVDAVWIVVLSILYLAPRVL